MPNHNYSKVNPTRLIFRKGSNVKFPAAKFTRSSLLYHKEYQMYCGIESKSFLEFTLFELDMTVGRRSVLKGEINI